MTNLQRFTAMPTTARAPYSSPQPATHNHWELLGAGFCRAVNRRAIRLLPLAVLTLTFLTACRPRAIICAYQPVTIEGWQATDTLRFSLPQIPDTKPYAFSVGVRTIDRIPYRDLWLVMELRSDTITTRDTVYVLLASDRARWQTRGNILHEIEQPAATHQLCEGQQPEVLIYHIMSAQQMPGITDVGLKVE